MKSILIILTLVFSAAMVNAQTLQGSWGFVKMNLMGNVIYFDDSETDKGNLLRSWVKMRDAENDEKIKAAIYKEKEMIYRVAKKIFKTKVEFKNINTDLYTELTTGMFIYTKQEEGTEVKRKEVDITLRYYEQSGYSIMTFPLFGDFHEYEKLKVKVKDNTLVLEAMPTASMKTGEFIMYYANGAAGSPKTRNSGLKLPEMVFVTGGMFIKGKDRPGWDRTRIVTVSNFSIGKYEVSVAEYRAFCEATGRVMYPDKTDRDDYPVGSIIFDDAVAYCKWLSELTGQQYRLPTSAEWEFAARGGLKSKRYIYSGSDDADAVAWFGTNSGSDRKAVGTKNPNELGLYDMSGNIREWSNDWNGDNNYEPAVNPRGGPASNGYKVMRGGSYFDDISTIQVTSTTGQQPAQVYGNTGFRIARSE